MSENHQNIEELFKNSFENAKVTPTENTWNNIENNLRSENYFYDKFKGYFVQPSTKIWINIQRKLFYVNFFRFNLLGFNFYYLVTIIALLFYGLYSVNDAQKSNNAMSYNHGVNQNKNIRQVIPNINVSNNINKKYENSINEKNINAISYNKVITDKNSYLSNTNSKLLDYIGQDNVTNENSLNNNQNTEIIAETANNKTTLEKPLIGDSEIKNIENAENIISEEVIKTNNNLIDNENSNSVDVSIENNEKLIVNNNYDLISMDKKNALYIPLDSLIVLYEFNYKDTFGNDAFGNPIIIDRTKWSVDVLWSPVYSISNIATINYEDMQYENEYNNALTPALSNSFGINTNFTYKNILIQGGIYYNQFKENFNYNESVLLVDTISYYETYYTYETVINTTSVLDLDTFLSSGNTVYIEYIDTNIVKTPNQRLLTEYDSIASNKPVRAKNTYSYVEIPLTVGYQFKYNKFTITPKLGLITGIFINSSGKTLNTSYLTSDLSENKTSYMKANFSAISSIGIEYKINDFFSIIADPYFRTSLNSIYNKRSNISCKFNAYGLKLGMRYNF